MKVYLGKQESIGGVKVPTEADENEYHEMRGMIKLSIYVKREDFPDAGQHVEKWMELSKETPETGSDMDIIAVFRALNENFDSITAEIAKQSIMLEKGLIGLNDKVQPDNEG